MQQLVNGAMPRHGLRWSSEHDRVLQEMANDGATKEDVARVVLRTPLGVYERAKALGVKFRKHLAWTEVEDTALRAGVAAGWSRKKTATTIPHRSLDSLSMRASRLGIGFTPGNRNDLWKEGDRLERAKAMWSAGKSGRVIAKILNCGLSRPAVIAKMLRAGLHRAAPKKPPKPKSAKKARARKAPRAVSIKIKVFVSGKPALAYPMSQTPFVLKDIRAMWAGFTPPPKWEAPVADNDVARIPLEQLQHKHCRWITGDPRKTPIDEPLFCGHDRQPGLAYCEAHAARAFHRVSDAPRQVFVDA